MNSGKKFNKKKMIEEHELEKTTAYTDLLKTEKQLLRAILLELIMLNKDVTHIKKQIEEM